MFLADLGGGDDDWVQFQPFLPAPKVNKIKPPIWALPELPDLSQELWFAVIGLPVSIVLMKRHISQGHRASHSINIMGIYTLCLSVCLSDSLPIPLSVCVCAQLEFFSFGCSVHTSKDRILRGQVWQERVSRLTVIIRLVVEVEQQLSTKTATLTAQTRFYCVV